MVQLRLQQTKAPSFAGVSDILKNAGLAMDRGFEAAQGMLGSYQEGQQESVDNEVFAELQALENREQIDAYFDKGMLKGRKVSPKLREHMAQMRGTAAVTALNRQSTANMLGGETRRQQEHDFTTGKRKQGIDNAAQFAAAWDEQYAGGTPGRPAAGTNASDAIQTAATTPGGGGQAYAPRKVSAEDRLMLARTLQTEAAGEGIEGMKDVGSVIFNRAGEGSIADVIMKPGQFSAWNGVTGYAGGEQGQDMDFEPDEASYKAADALLAGGHVDQTGGAKNYYSTAGKFTAPSWSNAGFKQRGNHWFGQATQADGTIPGGVPDDAQRAEALARADATRAQYGPDADPLAALRRAAGGEGSEFNTPTATPGRTPQEVLAGAERAGIPAYEEAAAVEAEGQALDEAAAAGVAVPAATTIETAVNPNQERDAYMKMLAEENQYLTGPELVAKANSLRDARTAGKNARAEVRALQVDELVSATIFSAAVDPNNITKADVANAVASIPDLTPTERLAAISKANKLVADDGVLSRFLTPDITDKIDPAVSRVLADEMAAGEESIRVLPQDRLYKYMETFGADPVQGLWDRLDLSNDKHTPETWGWGIGGEDGTDQNIIRKLTNEIALAAGVSPAVAAAGMAENFIRDPRGWNSAETRFQKTKTIAFLKLNMNDEARAAYEGKKESVALRRDELTKAAKDLKNLVTKRAKMTDGSAAAKLADGEIRRLRVTLKSGNSPAEADRALEKYIGPQGNGMADQLKKVEMGSPAYKAGVKLLLSQIDNDDELSASQKLLLRTRITG